MKRKGRVRGRRAEPAALAEVEALLGPAPWRRDLLIDAGVELSPDELVSRLISRQAKPETV